MREIISPFTSDYSLDYLNEILTIATVVSALNIVSLLIISKSKARLFAVFVLLLQNAVKISNLFQSTFLLKKPGFRLRGEQFFNLTQIPTNNGVEGLWPFPILIKRILTILNGGLVMTGKLPGHSW